MSMVLFMYVYIGKIWLDAEYVTAIFIVLFTLLYM